MQRLIVMSSLVAAIACGRGKPADPFAADMKMICAAGDHVATDQATVLALREISGKIKTAEAAGLMAAAMRAGPAERAALVKPALAKAGITRCPLFD